MNIRNRLKRLENDVIDDSQFCRCQGDEEKTEIRLKKTEYDCYSSGKYVRWQDSEIAKECERETENEKLTIKYAAS